jgi:hypothetical protein
MRTKEEMIFNSNRRHLGENSNRAARAGGLIVIADDAWRAFGFPMPTRHRDGRISDLECLSSQEVCRNSLGRDDGKDSAADGSCNSEQ